METVSSFSLRRMGIGAVAVMALATAAPVHAGASYQEFFLNRVSKCVDYQSGSFTLQVSSPIGDTSSFNYATFVTIRIGGMSYSTQLGRDCQYRAGATSAHLQEIVSLPAGGGALGMDVQLSWAGGALNATIRGLPPVAGTSVGESVFDSGALGAVSRTVVSTITMSSPTQTVTVNSSVPLSGSVTQKNKKSCGGIALRKVQLTGTTP